MSDVQALFNSTANLPMLPKVVQELLRLLDEDDPDTKNVIQKINRDPVIASKVLRLANTAHYGAARQVKTLEDALSLIGFAKLSTLVIASGVSESFSNVPNINLPLFWKRSFVCASISRHMAIELNQLISTRHQPELIYLGGLLHGIGQLVMHFFFPKAQKALLMADLAQSALERKRIEQLELGVDHCLVGHELTRRWSLPPEIRRIVRHYAEPKNTEADSSASVVHFAAHIAIDLLFKKPPSLILKETDSLLTTILAPSNEIWESRFETYSLFLSEAESFV